jgi:hypothetical protein
MAANSAQALERCPLCGTEFDASGLGCRPSCPMSAGCHVVCCPSCAYSFPQENAGLAGKLKRFLDQRRSAAAGKGSTL